MNNLINSTEKEIFSVPKRVSLREPIRLMGMGFIPYMTWIWIVTAVPLTILAKMLNINQFGLGLLGGMVTYTQISRLLGSYFIEQYDHRKATVIVTGFAHRGIWLLIAMLPLFAGHGNWTWISLLVLAYVSHFGAAFIDPGLASWVADLVPGRLQGRFYGQRMRLGLFASLAALIIVSYILDKTEAMNSTVLKFSVVIIFAFAAIAGMFEYVLYSFVPNLPMKAKTSHISLAKIIWKPLSDKEFVSFLLVYCTMYASAAFMGLFTYLFLIDVIKLTNVSVTVLAVMAPNLINAICYPFWGKITDLTGYKPTLVIGAIAYILFPVWYILATPQNWVGMYILGMIAYCFTSALDTGTAVMLYNKMTDKGKTNNMGSSYPAVTGVTCAVGGILCAILAGALAAWIGKDWHGSVIGHPMTYHQVLFTVMVGMRIVALLGLMGIRNKTGFSVSDTCNVIIGEVNKTAVNITRFLKFTKAGV